MTENFKVAKGWTRTARLWLATRLLLLAVGLVGVAHIAFLPPWEGFDEFAHWSSVQQIADTGVTPFYGRDRVSADVEAYSGPLPYLNPADHEDSRFPTYRDYRAAGSPTPLRPPIGDYRPGAGLNWQAQHPPLFYAALAPVYLAVKGLDWPAHLMVLRLGAWAMAFAGLCIGVLATERRLPEASAWIAPVMAGYPFLAPQFFPEMARLGNDSMCLLWAGLIWALLLKMSGAERGRLDAVWLGLALGAGLLTKAFFLPIGAGVVAWFILLWLRDRQHPAAPRDSHSAALRDAMICIAVAGVIGGAWYLRNMLEFGDLVGSNDMIQTARRGGMLAGLEKNLTALLLLKGLVTVPVSYVWAGTWSLAQPPWALWASLAGVVALTAVGYVLHLRRAAPLDQPLAWLPVLLLTPMILGLLYHLFSSIAGYGRSVTPGWYFHILAAPVAYAMALGWRWPGLTRLAATVTVMSTMAVWTLQLALFSGCAVKDPPSRQYDFTGAGCFIDGGQLAALGFPVLGAICLSVAAICGAAAAVMLARRDDTGALNS